MKADNCIENQVIEAGIFEENSSGNTEYVFLVSDEGVTVRLVLPE